MDKSSVTINDSVVAQDMQNELNELKAVLENIDSTAKHLYSPSSGDDGTSLKHRVGNRLAKHAEQLRELIRTLEITVELAKKL